MEMLWLAFLLGMIPVTVFAVGATMMTVGAFKSAFKQDAGDLILMGGDFVLGSMVGCVALAAWLGDLLLLSLLFGEWFGV